MQSKCTKLPSRVVTDEIRVRVSMREVLEDLGAHIRSRRRADCPLCKGSQKATVSYSDRRMHCFRCDFRGDIFALEQAVHHCDFSSALKHLAHRAGIALPTKMTPEERHKIVQQQAECQRVDKAAVKLENVERQLRLGYRDMIHRCVRKQGEVHRRLAELANGEPERWRQEAEGCWGWLAALHSLLQEALIAYAVLSFGPAEARARFTLTPFLRPQMIAQVSNAGGLFDDLGRWMEVIW